MQNGVDVEYVEDLKNWLGSSDNKWQFQTQVKLVQDVVLMPILFRDTVDPLLLKQKN